MSQMFQSVPESGERFRLREWVGHLCLFTPKQFREQVPMPNGATDVIEGDVVVLTAQPVQTFTNTWVLGKYVVPRLREAIGQIPVLARIEIRPGTENRDNPAHQLAAFSPQDAQFAEQYVRSQPAVQPAQQYGAPVPLPNSQPQGYGAPSPQDQQWATQQRYAPPGVTTNVVPAPPAPAPMQQQTWPAQQMTVSQPEVVAPVPTPAPQPPAPAPVAAPVPVPVTPVGPVAQGGTQGAPVMTDEQFAGMPEDVQKLLDAARYARLKAASGG